MYLFSHVFRLRSLPPSVFVIVYQLYLDEVVINTPPIARAVCALQYLNHGVHATPNLGSMDGTFAFRYPLPYP